MISKRRSVFHVHLSGVLTLAGHLKYPSPYECVLHFLQVETHLQNKSLAIDRAVNAKAMDKHGVEVVKVLVAAKKAKKMMAFKKREVNKAVDLAAATKAFMAEGGGKKKGKKKRGQDLERDDDVWDAMDKFNDDPDAEEETAVEPPES